MVRLDEDGVQINTICQNPVPDSLIVNPSDHQPIIRVLHVGDDQLHMLTTDMFRHGLDTNISWSLSNVLVHSPY